MSELFNDMQNVSQTAESEQKNTPEDEAFRLADKIYPVTANTLKEPQLIQAQLLTFKKIDLLRLAHFINDKLKDCDIILAGIDFCDDYKTTSLESDNIQEIWFDAAGMLKFLKWCEPREKDLFN